MVTEPRPQTDEPTTEKPLTEAERELAEIEDPDYAANKAKLDKAFGSKPWDLEHPGRTGAKGPTAPARPPVDEWDS